MDDEVQRVAALIASDPDELEHYLVLADLLQAQGDPLGELITLHSEVEFPHLHDPSRWVVTGPATARLVDHFNSHRKELLNELDPFLADIELRWRYGFVHTLRCGGPSSSAVWRDRLEALLSTRACAFLYALEVAYDSVAGLARLARHAPHHQFPVRRLQLAGTSSGEGLLDACGLFPSLETLRVGGKVHIDRPPTTLRELDLTHYDPVPLDNFWEAPWPRLETLRLQHVTELPADLLAGSRAPALRSFELGICGTRRKDRDRVVRALLVSPLLKQLKSFHIYEVPDYAAAILAEGASQLEHLESFYASGSAEATQVSESWTANKKSQSS